MPCKKASYFPLIAEYKAEEAGRRQLKQFQER